jgi:hypothetical protein
MRTVTFSNAEVAKAVNQKFVATWINRQPGFHNCDFQEEAHITKYKYECFATRNFCTFFTTPELDVLHYASGHYHPHLFLREVEFVRKLQASVLDRSNAFEKNALSTFRETLLAQAKVREREHDRILRMGPPQGMNNLEVFLSRREHFAEGMQHLAAVHRDLVLKAAINDGPVPWSEVVDSHLSGNSFQETICGDRNCKRPEKPGMN